MPLPRLLPSDKCIPVCYGEVSFSFARRFRIIPAARRFPSIKLMMFSSCFQIPKKSRISPGLNPRSSASRHSLPQRFRFLAKGTILPVPGLIFIYWRYMEAMYTQGYPHSIPFLGLHWNCSMVVIFLLCRLALADIRVDRSQLAR